MYLIGYDLGSSSVKVSLVNGDTGECVGAAHHPKNEMDIIAHQIGWAEQHPDRWWEALRVATQELFAKTHIAPTAVKAIGISYQMHGLVLVDKNQEVLRPAIIWCDSRAVEIGAQAFNRIGEKKCLSSLLNSPGNFTASKLKWVKDNEPDLYAKIYKAMLPGDFIAMKLTGEINTTISGLSEGMFWDFENQELADFLLTDYGLDKSLLPDQVPTFAIQGKLSKSAATQLGLSEGTPVAYRAGDQPNNALSLNVLRAGEIAATAGTSGVVYGVSDVTNYDPKSRVNTFAHANYTRATPNLGILLCINGTGILYSWAKKNLGQVDYEQMNALAEKVPVGSEGISVLPFGNGAERVLNNRNIGSHFCNLSFNVHTNAHIYRGILEGIVFSLKYGIDIMKEMGVQPSVIKAGHANLFLSPVFREALASVADVSIELYNTDGAQGAARGAGIGLGHFSIDEAFQGLNRIASIEPDPKMQNSYHEAYLRWEEKLKMHLA